MAKVTRIRNSRGMAGNKKVSISIDADLNRRLDALSYLTGRTRSQLVSDGLERQLRDLSPPQRASFETALRMATEREQGLPPWGKRVQS